MAALGGPQGLRRLTLPHATAVAALAELGAPREAVADAAPFRALTANLARYFRGEPEDFEMALDLGDGSEFQRRVWAALRQIPRGATRSYGRVAAEVGKPGGARAVGQAVGRNPLSIVVPCHRVVGATGLGGFGGGLEMKRKLLALEAKGN